MNRAHFIAIVTLLLLCSCKSQDGTPAPNHRGVYHWKTIYNPTQWEKQWIEEHRIDRLYIRLFDIEAGEKAGEPDWKMVPTATTQFRQKLPDTLDVVPVVYITTDAIQALGNATYDWTTREMYASLIVKRIDDMMADHWNGDIREVQLDCDWTSKCEQAYFALARTIKDILQERGITLSGTLRLHQLGIVKQWVQNGYNDAHIPFDRLMLMCYNTGRLQDPNTRNSILDFSDVRPYLNHYSCDKLPFTDIAWPVYGWGVEFDDKDNFKRLVNSSNLTDEKGKNARVREEWGNPREIRRTQKALPKLDTVHTTILYHLDSLNLSKYSYEEIEAFYSR